MSGLVDRLWYGRGRPLGFLAPLAWLYRAVSERRRRAAWRARNEPLPLPVVVVGNLTAGGTGKSPLTARLVKAMADRGWQPVILSRGYGGKAGHYPLLVTADTPATDAGDEPVMLARETGVPVVVDPKRRRAAEWVVARQLGDVLICDDGLQHYPLPRDIELAVFDGARGVGNGALIPVGPLREPISRLSGVDFVVINGAAAGKPLGEGGRLTGFGDIEHPDMYPMTLTPSALIHVRSGQRRPLSDLDGQAVHAIAGIGNPARFFATLDALGANVRATPFADHHAFRASELTAEPEEWLVMTAKDAVKCRDIAPDNAWYLAVEAQLPAAALNAFLDRLAHCRSSVY